MTWPTIRTRARAPNPSPDPKPDAQNPPRTPTPVPGDFAEATIGTPSDEEGLKWCKLFNTPDFSVTAVADVAGAELCGALKNVVALG